LIQETRQSRRGSFSSGGGIRTYDL